MNNILMVGFCFFMLSIFNVTATPVIGIGSMYDLLKSEEQSLSKRIYNTGNSTAFVRIQILEVFPGNRFVSEELLQKDISGSTLEKDRLIVTPLRLIIPPSGFQSARILWAGERKVERYFRVRFTPVLPEANDGFGLNATETNLYRKESLTAGLNVLTGYGAIVIVQPGKPVFNSIIDTSYAEYIIVKNNGNTTISLDNIRYCKSGNTDCGSVLREIILPGRIQKLAKKSGYKTNFSLIEGEKKQLLSF